MDQQQQQHQHKDTHSHSIVAGSAKSPTVGSSSLGHSSSFKAHSGKQNSIKRPANQHSNATGNAQSQLIQHSPQLSRKTLTSFSNFNNNNNDPSDLAPETESQSTQQQHSEAASCCMYSDYINNQSNSNFSRSKKQPSFSAASPSINSDAALKTTNFNG